jgi:amino acid adenylation domain-containing protein
MSNYTQRETLVTAYESEQHRAFWKKELPAEWPIMSFPTTGRCITEDKGSGDRFDWKLSQELTSSLRQFAAQEGLTLSCLLLAAYQILLCRHTGQNHILVGIPVDASGDGSCNGSTGNVGRWVPIYCDCSDRPTLKSVLKQVAKRIEQVQLHMDLPLADIIGTVEVRAGETASRSLQAFMSYQASERLREEIFTFMRSAESVTDTDCSRESNISCQPVFFDIGVDIVDAGQGIQLHFMYRPSSLSHDVVYAMAGRYEVLLENIPFNVEMPISHLPLLTQREHQQLLGWTFAPAGNSSGHCVHELFEIQAKKTPQATAVVYQDESLSYEELDKRSNQLAHYLQSQGVKPDTLVGICIERSLEMVVGLMGILKSGGAYVPLDPRAPAARIADIVADAQMSLVLLHHKTVLPESISVPVIYIDNDWKQLVASQPSSAVNSRVSLDNLSYVIYTSGSTGRPKGFAYKHRGLTNYTEWMQGEYRLSPTDRVLQKSPCTFDVSIWEIFLPLYAGAKVIVAEQEGHHDVLYLKRMIEAERITVLNFVPSMLQVFIDDTTEHNLDSLRLVLCAGETLKPSLVNQFLNTFPSCELHNLYGPSESGIVTACRCDKTQVDSISNVGKPIAAAELYVVDKELQLVPVGVAGELLIGGPGLARDYLNRPELTAEKFIHNPFRRNAAGPLYKSGDLLRWLPDGSLAFVGRVDHQVKLHGIRLELGEIEAALSRHPDIRLCAVLLREDVHGNKRLVAYIVPVRESAEYAELVMVGGSEERTPPITRQMPPKWHTFLLGQLPEAIVPKTYVFMTSFPFTSSGKIDRSALPPPVTSRPSLGRLLEPPSTDTQRQVARIWQELLQLDAIGIDDIFFELGGHSLLVLKTQAPLSRIFRLEISVVALMKHSTVRTLAHYIDCLRAGEVPVEVETVRSRALREQAIARRKNRVANERAE